MAQAKHITDVTPVGGDLSGYLPNATVTALHLLQSLSVPQGGTGAATLSGLLKGNGTSAVTSAVAGTDYSTPGTTQTVTAPNTFNLGTLLDKGNQVFNVKSYGVKGDTVIGTSGTVSASSTSFTDSTASWTNAINGKTITITGAAASGKNLVTTATYVSATQLTLAVAATTAVTNTTYALGTDDTQNIKNAIADMANGGVLYFPQSAGQYLITSMVRIPYSGITIAGAGQGASTICAGYSGADTYANPGLFVFQSNIGTKTVNNSTVTSISFNLNHFGTPGVCWWGSSTGTTASYGFTIQNVEFYARGVDSTGSTAAFAVHGDYSIFTGPLKHLTLQNVYFHDGDATTATYQTGLSVLLAANSLSHVTFDNCRFRNVYDNTIQFLSSVNPAPRNDWRFVNCSFVKTLQNYFGVIELNNIVDQSRNGVVGVEITGCTFDHTLCNWTYSSNVSDISFYNSRAVNVVGNVFINSRKVWNPGISFPVDNEDIGENFSDNVVYKCIEFQDPDGNIASKYSGNIFYEVQSGGFLGGYGRHRNTMITDNLIYNCAYNPVDTQPYNRSIFCIQDSGTVIEGNVIYNDSPQGTAAAPTVTSAGVSGNLNGAYTYKITFVLQDFGESAGGATSSSISVTNGKVNLTNIPLGKQGCAQRKIYRTAAGGANGTQKLVAILNDNTTTNYTDNIADSALGAVVPTVDKTVNGMDYIFAELSAGGSKDTKIIWKNNTIIGAGANIASFYLDSDFSHVIQNNIGITESTIKNSQTNGTPSVTPLAGTDVVDGNYMLSGVPITNANTANAIVPYSIKSSPYTVTATDTSVDAFSYGYGTALSFSGTSGSVTGNAPTTNTSGWTLAAWIYPTGVQSDYSSIINVGNGSTGYELGLSPSGGSNYLWGNINYVGSTTSTASIPLNTWTHVAFSNVSGTSRLYINGVYTGQSTGSTPITPANSMYVGTESGTSRRFKGSIDEVRVWSTGLSASQISGLYTSRTVPTANLVTEWLFNEGSGTLANDSSSTGNTGTISGASYSSNANGNNTVTLLDAALVPGRWFVIRNSGTGSVALNTTSGQTINGNSSLSLAAQSYAFVQSNGTNWNLIGSSSGLAGRTTSRTADITVGVAGQNADYTMVGGINDDVTIQAALNSMTNGQKMWIGPGTYKVYANLLISKSNIEIELAPGAVIQAQQRTDTGFKNEYRGILMLQNSGSGNTQTRVYIHGGTIDCNLQTETSALAIWGSGTNAQASVTTTDIVIERMRFINKGNSTNSPALVQIHSCTDLNLGRVRGVYIRKCLLKQSDSEAIRLRGTYISNIYIEDCDLSNVALRTINQTVGSEGGDPVRSDSNIFVKRNHFHDNMTVASATTVYDIGMGSRIGAVTMNVIDNIFDGSNEYQSNDNPHIQMYATLDSRIEGNTFKNTRQALSIGYSNGGDPFYDDPNQGLSISNNHFINVFGVLTDMDANTRSIWTNNIFIRCGLEIFNSYANHSFTSFTNNLVYNTNTIVEDTVKLPIAQTSFTVATWPDKYKACFTIGGGNMWTVRNNKFIDDRLLQNPANTPGTTSLVTAGSQSARTYYYRYVYRNESGQTMPSPSTSVSVGANQVLKITPTISASNLRATSATSGVTPLGESAINFIDIYVGTTAGSETLQASLAHPDFYIQGNGWTEAAAGLVSGTALPTSNTTHALTKYGIYEDDTAGGFLGSNVIADNDFYGFSETNAIYTNAPTSSGIVRYDNTITYVNSSNVLVTTIDSQMVYPQSAVSGAVTLNRYNGRTQVLNLTGNATVSLLNGYVKGAELTLQLNQDSTGSRTVTFSGSNYKLGAGGSFVASTSANATDVITFYWDGSTWIETTRHKGDAASTTVNAAQSRTVLTVSTATTIPTATSSTISADFVYFVSGTTTITMPAAANNKNSYKIYNSGSGVVTIVSAGGTTLATLAAGDSCEELSDNTNWYTF